MRLTKRERAAKRLRLAMASARAHRASLVISSGRFGNAWLMWPIGKPSPQWGHSEKVPYNCGTPWKAIRRVAS